MLVLSRKVGEKLVIGDNITIVVNRVAGNRVTIGIDAPGEVRIVRGELKPVVEQFRSRTIEFKSEEPALAWTSGGYDREEDAQGASVPRLAK
jgi:carbon storage regulator CsrA